MCDLRTNGMRLFPAMWVLAAVWFVSVSFVVKVDGIPNELTGAPLYIKSELDGRTIDSLHIEGKNAVLKGVVSGSEWCRICYSYPIENGVLTYFRPIFLEAELADIDDTVKVVISDYDRGEMIVKGDGLNAGYAQFADFMKSLQPMDSVSIGKFLHYVSDRVGENHNNPFGAFLASFISSALQPEAWLELYDGLSPEMKNYPAVKRGYERNRAICETAAGERFKDIKGMAPDGSVASLSDYVGKGKYVLVDFWAYWCGPCRKMAKEILMPIYEKYKDNAKFMILGVATSGDADKQKEAIDNLNYPWPQLIDNENVSGDIYGFNSIPYLILFGPDGSIVHRNFSGEDIPAFVEGILAD